MKPHLDGFAVVTAGTIDSPELTACVDSWRVHAHYQWPIYHIQGVYGSVPAFAQGVREALEGGASIIACLHNDLLIYADGWDARVVEAFAQFPQVGLLGFGGAKGLGSDDIYNADYQPQQLARQDFVSNMRDAEAHGRRSRQVEKIACLDGFSQIGRASFWKAPLTYVHPEPTNVTVASYVAGPLTYIQRHGVLHHAYDSWLGALAHRLGWDVLMLPVHCHHLGGRTAVGDPAYHASVREQGGDQGVWAHAHQMMYRDCRDVLPLRVP